MTVIMTCYSISKLNSGLWEVIENLEILQYKGEIYPILGNPMQSHIRLHEIEETYLYGFRVTENVYPG